MGGVSAKRIILLAMAAASLGWGAPTISSLQSSIINGTPADVTGITSGTVLPGNGFRLYINGSFSLAVINVRWLNTSTNAATLFDPTSLTISPTQIGLTIPFNLFQTQVLSPVAVTVTVQDLTGVSNPATFTINPPLAPIQPVLPSGTVNQFYSANFVTGGTPPFAEAGLTGGTLPFGLNAPNPSITISGTPTQTGVFNNIQTAALDFWGNSVSGNDTIEIVDVPTLTSLSPNSSGAGAGTLTMTVNGSNFVAPVTVGTQQIPGSHVQWIVVNALTPLATTFVNSTQLTAVVPSALLATPATAAVTVVQPSNASSNVLPFNVAGPAITALSPPSAGAGSATFNLAVTGANFVSGSQVSFDGSPLTTSFVSSTTLNATVPAALIAGPKVASIVVTNPGGIASPAAFFTVINTLAIATTSFPSGISGSSYSFTLTGRGGTPPYTWSASGLPISLVVNPATGVISGVLQASGTFVITVGLRDAAGTTASTAQFQLVASPQPVSIAPSSSLPSGVVGVAYLGFVFANGGAEPYTFSLGSGSLPDGLTLSSGGMVSGTPKTPGQFSFSVVVRDATGATASQDFRITIRPAPLSITGGPTTTTVPAGAPISITFTGTGGVGPYRFTLCGSLPPGTTFSNGVLSGTPTTPGTFTVCVTIADSTDAVFTKDFTLTVAPPAALSLSGSLPDGKVGVPYAGQISAAGGVGPYSYAGSGLPSGLSLSASGSISGTPGAAGQFSFTATATDSTGAKANGTFRITIVPADLAIVTASLPDGVVGVAYSASLIASGGVPPYTWTVTGLPDGLTATAAGAIGGTPTKAGKFTVNVVLTDAAGTSTANRRVSYSVTIAPAPLAITTASAPNGTVGTAYTASFAASGGAAPLTFSASGLPAGLSMSAAGSISGTPTAAGPATIVVTVKDAAGASTSKSFPVTIGLPSAPPLNLNIAGISDTASPLQQPRLQVTLGNTFPVDVVVTLTLSFAPDSGADDPAIQFSGGGRTARITVPAGATNGATDVGVQTGSVAGVIAITAQLQASGLDVTPSPAPRRTIRVVAAAPVIVPGTLTAVRNSTGFTVTLTGYVTDRELTQAIFAFTAASGSNLQTTTLTVPADTLFAQYFSGSAATPFGSQFTYTQPFTVTGSTQVIVSVTVTLVNKIGQSAPVTATLN